MAPALMIGVGNLTGVVLLQVALTSASMNGSMIEISGRADGELWQRPDTISQLSAEQAECDETDGNQNHDPRSSAVSGVAIQMRSGIVFWNT